MLRKQSNRFNNLHCKCRTLLWISIVFLCLIITGCDVNPPMYVSSHAFTPEEISTYLISGPDCTPPCWHGLYAGETSMDQTIEIINGLSFIDQDSLIVTPMQNTGTTNEIYAYGFSEPYNSSGVSLEFLGRVLDDILIYPSIPPSIESVIEVLGYPDFVEPLPCRGSCTYFLIWKEERIAIEIILDSSAHSRLRNDYLVNPASEVYRILFESAEWIIISEGNSKSSWVGFIEN
jgi:hypothetical protein